MNSELLQKIVGILELEAPPLLTANLNINASVYSFDIKIYVRCTWSSQVC